MANTQEIFQWFYKGISQDDYSTQSHQVLFSTGLDLNKDSYSVQLESDLTSLITTDGHDMNCWFYVEDAGGNRTAVAAWEAGEVYKSNGTNDVPDFTFADSRIINNTTNMNKFVYFISGWNGSQLK